MQPRIKVIVVGSITTIVEAGIVAANKVIDPLVASLAIQLLASWVVVAWRFASYFGGGRPRALPVFVIYDSIRSKR